MEYTILILLLPLLSFLFLGLAGMKLSPRRRASSARRCWGGDAAELLHGVRILHGRTRCRRGVPDADSVEYGLVADQPYAAYRHGHPAGPDFGDDARGDLDRLADGACLLAGLHEGRTGFPALLRLSVAVYDEHDGACGGDQYFPDVPILGAGGRQLLSAGSASTIQRRRPSPRRRRLLS